PVAKVPTNRPAPPPFSSIMARRRRWLAPKLSVLGGDSGEEGAGSLGQGVEDIEALFSGGGDDGPEADEDFGAFEGPEAARDFHFDLGHAQVLFGQIVGERDVEVDEEAQGLVLEGLEPDEEIVAGALLFSFPWVGRGVEGRQGAVEGEPSPDGLPVAIDKALNAVRFEGAVARFF